MAKDVWFFIAFFGILLVLGFATQGGGLFEGAGSATSTTTGVGTSTLSTYPSENTVGTSTTPATPPTPPLTPREIEEKVARIYRELDILTEELRIAKLQEPVSPTQEVLTSVQVMRVTQTPTRNIFHFVQTQAIQQRLLFQTGILKVTSPMSEHHSRKAIV